MIRRAWRAFTRGLLAEAGGWHTGAEIIADEQARNQAPAPGNTRAPATSPVPGQQNPRPAHGQPPARPAPAPAPALTPHELAALDRYQHLTGVHVLPGHASAAREIADGLRQRFPALDDTTLGVIAMDLRGYAVALAIGLPAAGQALQAVIDCYALAAEDLTRLDRTEAP